MNGIRVVIPAAGKSSRMGPVDKRLIEFEGVSLVARAVRTAACVDLKPVVVVRPEDAPLRKRLSELSVHWVVNPHPERGPASSITAGLMAVAEGSEASEAPPVLVLIPDMPFVGPEHLRRVVSAYRDGGLDRPVTAVYGGIPAPPVILPPRLCARLPDARGTMRRLLASLGEEPLPVPLPAEALFDLDRPEDLARLDPCG